MADKGDKGDKRKRAKTTLNPRDLFRSTPGVSAEGNGALLTIDEGRFSGLTFEVGRNPVEIGRSRRCDVVLRGAPGVSRVHARVIYRGGAWFIEDLDSRHGLLVNGEQIDGRRQLFNGDTIQLAEEAIRFSTSVVPPDPRPSTVRTPAPPSEMSLDIDVAEPLPVSGVAGERTTPLKDAPDKEGDTTRPARPQDVAAKVDPDEEKMEPTALLDRDATLALIEADELSEDSAARRDRQAQMPPPLSPHLLKDVSALYQEETAHLPEAEILADDDDDALPKTEVVETRTAMAEHTAPQAEAPLSSVISVEDSDVVRPPPAPMTQMHSAEGLARGLGPDPLEAAPDELDLAPPEVAPLDLEPQGEDDLDQTGPTEMPGIRIPTELTAARMSPMRFLSGFALGWLVMVAGGLLLDHYVNEGALSRPIIDRLLALAPGG